MNTTESFSLNQKLTAVKLPQCNFWMTTSSLARVRIRYSCLAFTFKGRLHPIITTKLVPCHTPKPITYITWPRSILQTSRVTQKPIHWPTVSFVQLRLPFCTALSRNISVSKYWQFLFIRQDVYRSTWDHLVDNSHYCRPSRIDIRVPSSLESFNETSKQVHLGRHLVATTGA